MFRTLLLGIILVVINACNSQKTNVSFSKISNTHVENFDTLFARYANIDVAANFELNAVLCSFAGDYKGAIEFATKSARTPLATDASFELTDLQLQSMKDQLNLTLTDPKATFEAKTEARQMLNLILSPKEIDKVFGNYTLTPARDFIVKQSSNFHYVLINEAHYNSANRNFTTSLLKPLYDEGYRYLALETLTNNDQKLLQKGYPIDSTGFYTKDSVFGNMVREALRLGYKLIAYEYPSYNNSVRDSMQALNIYERTLKTDPTGKVLVHAGHSHIAETGNAIYRPMGMQLKKLINQEILTIDQENMTEKTDSEKMNSYFKYAIGKYQIASPSVFVNESGVLVDPINSGAIDIQVYHPITTYIMNRPSWLLNDRTEIYPLPKEFNDYQDNLIQVLKQHETLNAVPLDQCVIHEDSGIAVPTGEYDYRIIDRQGTLVGVGTLSVN